MLLPEDVGRRDPTLVHGHVSEVPLPGDVTDRPQTIAGAHVPVRCDRLGVLVQTDGLDTDRPDVRSPSGSDEQSLGLELRATVQLDRDPAVTRGNPRCARSGMEVDPLGFQRIA